LTDPPVWQTDRQTDKQTELPWHIRAIAYMLSRVKIYQVLTILHQLIC